MKPNYTTADRLCVLRVDHVSYLSITEKLTTKREEAIYLHPDIAKRIRNKLKSKFHVITESI